MHAITYSDPVILAYGTKKVYKGIKYLCSNRGKGRGYCDGQTQYASKMIDKTVLDMVKMLLQAVKSIDKDEAIKEKYEQAIKSKKRYYSGLLKEYEKEKSVLQKLIEEVGRAMIGESILSLDIINQSINIQKEKITRLENQIPEALAAVNENKETSDNLDHYYTQLKSWADEFEVASKERKKVIIGRLFYKINIGKEGRIGAKVNIDYGQFITDSLILNRNFTTQLDTLGRAFGC